MCLKKIQPNGQFCSQKNIYSTCDEFSPKQKNIKGTRADRHLLKRDVV